MSYLHSQNIVHRHLKTSNIFLNDLLFPKIGGLSYAKFLTIENEDEENNSFGNPFYIAPEITQNGEYKKSSDVYSFGKCVYEIMTGFQKQGKLEFEEGFPKAYQELIEACCNKEPIKRPTFDEIIAKLRTDNKFITSEVDSKIYSTYIEFIDDEINKMKITSKRAQIFPTFDLDSIYKECTKTKYQENKQYIFKSPKTNFQYENIEKIRKIYEDAFERIYEYQDKKTGDHYSMIKSKYRTKHITLSQESEIKKEFDELCKLNHPSIQRFYCFILTKKNDQLISTVYKEYIPHRTLFDLLSETRKNQRQLSITSTNKLKMIYGIASGLLYLHSHKIFNVKPNPKNIIVDSKYEIKLSNIGKCTQSMKTITISKSTSAGTDETSFYLSPEELKSEENITDKSDVYSYSLIVYEIITNDIVFTPKEYKNPPELIRKIRDENYRPKLNEKIPNFYQQLLEKCWEEEPEKRPTFQNIIDELEQNKDILTLDINVEEYLEYQKFIKQSQEK